MKRGCGEWQRQHGELSLRSLPWRRSGSQSFCKCAFGQKPFIGSFTCPKYLPAAHTNASDSAICSFHQWPNERVGRSVCVCRGDRGGWVWGGGATLWAPSGLTEMAALSILPSASLFSYITSGYSSHLSKTVCSESAAILNHNFSWRRGRVQN